MDKVVIIDKPKGLTSHDVVQKVKRLYGAKKAGHTGTHDPLATGVLAVCLDSATKYHEKFMMGDKEYEVGILFGTTTTTFDTEGEVVEKKDVPKDILERMKKMLPEFTGRIRQKPPYFSAVKYRGRPLYKWAREGKFIDLPQREVEIKELEIKGIDGNVVTARIVCSKGTYIRALCHDLGQRLGCGACIAALRRIATGPFHIKDATPLADLPKQAPAAG